MNEPGVNEEFLERIREFSGLDVQTIERWHLMKHGRIIDMRNDGMRLRAIWQEEKKHLVVREFWLGTEAHGKD
jgi:hypothetical protein